VHFWDPAALPYPWLESVPDLERAFLPPDYTPLVQRELTPWCSSRRLHAGGESAEVTFVERLAIVEPRIVATWHSSIC